MSLDAVFFNSVRVSSTLAAATSGFGTSFGPENVTKILFKIYIRSKWRFKKDSSQEANKNKERIQVEAKQKLHFPNS